MKKERKAKKRENANEEVCTVKALVRKTKK